MLKRIHIHNYRTFVNFEWSPPAACVLVGENGAGKSAWIEVLWLLQDLLCNGESYRKSAGYPGTRTEWLREAEQSIEVEVVVGGEPYTYRVEYDEVGGKGAIREELRAPDGVIYRAQEGLAELFGDRPPAPKARTTIPLTRDRSFIPLLEPRPENQRVVAFREFFRTTCVIKPDPLRFENTASGEAAVLDRNLSNFADWYRGRVQEDPDAAHAHREDLRQALAGFVQLRLEPLTPEVKELRVRFSFSGTDYEVPWARLSDGQRQLIALYGVLRFAAPKATLIALDEIENYVAAAEIQPWLRAVTDLAAANGCQLIVVSHHPEAINYMAADAAWRMWRDPTAGHTRIARLEPDLSAGETAYDLVKLGLPRA